MFSEWVEIGQAISDGGMSIPQIAEGLLRSVFTFIVTGFTIGMLLWSIYLRTGWKSFVLLLASPFAWIACGHKQDYRRLLLAKAPSAQPIWLGALESTRFRDL